MSSADDGRILAKLPKVKVLRNNQREGGLAFKAYYSTCIRF